MPQAATEVQKTTNKTFTPEQLKAAWSAFAEKRKAYQAEYHLLCQEIEIHEHLVTVPLHNTFQETLLNSLKIDLLSWLREQVGNSAIQLVGEFQTVTDDKKVLYTNREKFEYLMEKNPKLKELKERLGLDSDF